MHLVQVIIASTLSGPSLWISSLTATKSVTNSSPLFVNSTTTGSNPAVKMDLKQDFWSIRDHITYLDIDDNHHSSFSLQNPLRFRSSLFEAKKAESEGKACSDRHQKATLCSLDT